MKIYISYAPNIRITFSIEQFSLTRLRLRFGKSASRVIYLYQDVRTDVHFYEKCPV